MLFKNVASEVNDAIYVSRKRRTNLKVSSDARNKAKMSECLLKAKMADRSKQTLKSLQANFGQYNTQRGWKYTWKYIFLINCADLTSK